MILSDSVIFRAKKGTVTDLQIHATIFGAFSDEIKEGEQISSFVGIGSKNYAYETMKKDTKEKVKQVVKVKGLTLNKLRGEESRRSLFSSFPWSVGQTNNYTNPLYLSFCMFHTTLYIQTWNFYEKFAKISNFQQKNPLRN